jgi:regulator of ribosome biosynthesis
VIKASSKMSSLASQVLADAALADSLLASTVVEKPLALELDLGNMLAIDTNQLDKEQVTTPDYLLSLARDNTQLLINSIWQLETERVEDAVIAKFPPPTYKLPREKPAPKPKAMTKWEKYAKDKGKDI